jgi:hypothetical protein
MNCLLCQTSMLAVPSYLYYLISYHPLINTYPILSDLNFFLAYLSSYLLLCAVFSPCHAPPLPVRPYPYTDASCPMLYHLLSCAIPSMSCCPCPCLPLSHRSPTENNPRLCGRPAGHQHCTVLPLSLNCDKSLLFSFPPENSHIKD